MSNYFNRNSLKFYAGSRSGDVAASKKRSLRSLFFERMVTSIMLSALLCITTSVMVAEARPRTLAPSTRQSVEKSSSVIEFNYELFAEPTINSIGIRLHTNTNIPFSDLGVNYNPPVYQYDENGEITNPIDTDGDEVYDHQDNCRTTWSDKNDATAFADDDSDRIGNACDDNKDWIIRYAPKPYDSYPCADPPVEEPINWKMGHRLMPARDGVLYGSVFFLSPDTSYCVGVVEADCGNGQVVQGSRGASYADILTCEPTGQAEIPSTLDVRTLPGEPLLLGKPKKTAYVSVDSSSCSDSYTTSTFSKPFCSIQKAVNTMVSGSGPGYSNLIKVAKGVYHERVEIPPSLHGITLSGDQAVLDGRDALRVTETSEWEACQPDPYGFGCYFDPNTDDCKTDDTPSDYTYEYDGHQSYYSENWLAKWNELVDNPDTHYTPIAYECFSYDSNGNKQEVPCCVNKKKPWEAVACENDNAKPGQYDKLVVETHLYMSYDNGSVRHRLYQYSSLHNFKCDIAETSVGTWPEATKEAGAGGFFIDPVNGYTYIRLPKEASSANPAALSGTNAGDEYIHVSAQQTGFGVVGNPSNLLDGTNARLVFDGFEFRHYSVNAISLSFSQDGWIRRSIFRFTKGGIDLKNSFRMFIEGNKFEDTIDAYLINNNRWIYSGNESDFISLTGPGSHQIVIRNNSFENSAGDAVGATSYGLSDNYSFPGRQKVNYNIDIHNNSFKFIVDDAIETDGDAINSRIWYNSIDTVLGSGVSTAAVFTGPTWIINNLIMGYKFQGIKALIGSRGWVHLYNNTIIARLDKSVISGAISAAAGLSGLVSRNNIVLANGNAITFLETGFSADCGYGSANPRYSAVTTNDDGDGWHNWVLLECKPFWRELAIDMDYDALFSFRNPVPATTCNSVQDACYRHVTTKQCVDSQGNPDECGQGYNGCDSFFNNGGNGIAEWAIFLHEDSVYDGYFRSVKCLSSGFALDGNGDNKSEPPASPLKYMYYDSNPYDDVDDQGKLRTYRLELHGFDLIYDQHVGTEYENATWNTSQLFKGDYTLIPDHFLVDAGIKIDGISAYYTGDRPDLGAGEETCSSSACCGTWLGVNDYEITNCPAFPFSFEPAKSSDLAASRATKRSSGRHKRR